MAQPTQYVNIRPRLDIVKITIFFPPYFSHIAAAFQGNRFGTLLCTVTNIKHFVAISYHVSH